MKAEELAGLPAEWRRALAEAAQMGDEDAMLTLVGQIAPEHPGLARALNELVNGFDFTEIIRLAQS